MFRNQTVKDVMNKKIVTVESDISIWQATNKMRTSNVGCVVVLEDKNIVGVFSERDLVSKVLPKRYDVDKTKVSEVMTSPVITVTADLSLSDVVYITATRYIRHLPVLSDSGKLVGMVSMRDLLYLIVNQLLKENYLQIKTGT
ncbi:MAG: CBS domain-containing protein [Pseudomonadota bacterium]|nr:CBS domain-containing protein [Pseudomonadota bacterium]